MPSPFPGMDPWLESPRYFSDFHFAMSCRISAELNRNVCDRYVSKIVSRSFPDDHEPLSNSQTLPNEDFEELAIELWTRGDERLVTSIELLSIANKTTRNQGRKMYLAKQREMRANGVHLVEIDLLRAGLETTITKRSHLAEKTGGPCWYHVSLWRADKEFKAYGFPISLTDPLPTIPIPLLSPDPDVLLNLQAVFTRTYDEALYARRIRYDQPCEPPLIPQAEEWARRVLAGPTTNTTSPPLPS